MACVNPTNYNEYIDVMETYLEEDFGTGKEKAQNVARDDYREFVRDFQNKEEYRMFYELANEDGSVDVRFNGTSKATRMKMVSVDKQDNGNFVIGLQNGKST